MRRSLSRRIWVFLWTKLVWAGCAIAATGPVRWFVRQKIVILAARAVVWTWRQVAQRIWLPVGRLVRRIRVFLGRHEIWYYLITWAVCVFIARAILTSSPVRIAGTVVGLMVLALVWRRIDLGIVLLMVMSTGFIHHNALPKPITFGGQGFHATELLVLFMFLTVLIRGLADRRLEFFNSPLTVPLLLFFFAVLVAIGVAYTRHLADIRGGTFPFHRVYNIARPVFHYLLFFVVAFGLKSNRELKRIFILLILLCIVVSVMMVIQYRLGTKVNIFIGSVYGFARVESLNPEEESVTRSLPPGLSLIMLLLPLTMTLACVTPRRAAILFSMASVALGIGLVFSFTRNYWLSTLLALFIIWLLAARQVKLRLGTATVVIIVATILFSTTAARLAPGTAAERFGQALSERFKSSISRSVTTEGSLRDRMDENRHAIQQIKQHPILGVGVGYPLHYKEWTRPGTWTKLVYPLYDIHNSYLELWMVYGLLGVISFTWLSVAFMRRSITMFMRARNPSWRLVALCMFAGYIAFLVRATVTMSILHEVFNITVACLMWGTIEAGWRLQGLDEPDAARIEPVSSPVKALRRLNAPVEYDRA